MGKFKTSILRTATMALAVFALGACVTINVYFPAAEAREAAKEFVDKVIGEPLGGAHRAPEVAAESIRKELAAQLLKLQKLDTDALLARRYERLMSYGIA